MAALAAAALSFPAAAAAAEPGVPAHGRAWELVTPSGTAQAIVQSVEAVSATGDRAVVLARGALQGAEAATFLTHNLAERTAGGWEIAPLEYPDRDSHLNILDITFHGPKFFNSDFSSSLWTNPLPLQPGQEQPDIGLYRSRPGGGYELLANMGRFEWPEVAIHGTSPGLQRVVFSSDGHLLPDDAGRLEGHSVYEIDGTELRQLDLGNDGELLSACGSRILEFNDREGLALSESRNAVSRDASRVFIASRGPSCSGTERMYMREGSTTTEISASQCTRLDCGPEDDITFAGATPDGSVAFLVTAQQLTDDDMDADPDLYRYDVASGALARVTAGKAEGISSSVTDRTFVFPSEDGSRVYLEAYGQLVPGLGSGGGLNIYLADSEGLHYVAESVPRVQATADGRFLALATAAPLEAADIDGREDLYRYDAGAGSMKRLSGSGASAGNGDFDVGRFDLADSGRVFFDTAEPLVPQDRNDLDDAYERADGELGLASGGVPGYSAKLVIPYLELPSATATPDGSTVLFKTAAPLLPQDRDGGDYDIYAARVGGGFPEPQALSGCGDAACGGAPGGRPPRPAPRTLASGPGRIGFAPLGPVARRQAATTGWLDLLAEVPTPGRLTARARARVGGAVQLVASGNGKAAETGPLRLRLRLSAEARQALGRGSALRVRLALRLAPAGIARAVSFTLERG